MDDSVDRRGNDRPDPGAREPPSRRAPGCPSMGELAALVGRSVRDAEVRAFLGPQPVEKAGPYSGRYFLTSKALGYAIGHDKRGRIGSVFLYVAPADGYAAFAGPLDHRLSAGDGQVEVRRRLGVPTRSGGVAGPDPHAKAGWDRFDSERVCVHFRYGEEGVTLITIMAPDAAP